MVELKNPGLFEKELEAARRARNALDGCSGCEGIAKQEFEALLESYTYLLKRYERHLTISDRIEGALKAEATTDHLTGLLNRKAFEHVASKLLAKRPLDGAGLYLVIMDLDGFKGINDTYGHATGDKVLQEVSDFLMTTLRSFDVCARLGGEEFAILASVPKPTAAMQLGERLRASIEALVILEAGQRVNLTTSLGITNFYSHDSLDEAVKAADALMYQAKRAGRNQVVIDF